MPSPRGARGGDGERGLDRDRYKRPVRLSRSRSPVNTHRRSRSPRRNSSPARRISRSPARRERSPPRRRPRSRSPPSPRKDGESVDKEVLSLQADEVAYLLGRDGSTKRRLESSSGCRVEVDNDLVEFTGTKNERELCRLCIGMTLQQRRGKMTMNFADIQKRPDCTTVDVPLECVGFVLGNKGNTLRQFEERTKVYMVFDNETKHGNCKRLFILGKPAGRDAAVKAVNDAVALRLRKESSRRPSGRSRSRSPRRPRDRSRDRGGRADRRSRSRSQDRKPDPRDRESNSGRRERDSKSDRRD